MRGVRNGSLIMTVAHHGIMEQKDFGEQILTIVHNSKPELQSL
jgi:hypothetical protein